MPAIPTAFRARTCSRGCWRRPRTYGAVREDAQVDAIEPRRRWLRRADRRPPRRGARACCSRPAWSTTAPTCPTRSHDEALARGLLRYCPICDGYEVTDKRVGVIGTGDHGMREALFLRGYTQDVTLIAPEARRTTSIRRCEAALDDAGIVRVDGPCGDYAIEGDKLALDTAERAAVASTASIPRSDRSSAPNWRSRPARAPRRRLPGGRRRTSAPRSPACSPRATW